MAEWRRGGGCVHVFHFQLPGKGCFSLLFSLRGLNSFARPLPGNGAPIPHFPSQSWRCAASPRTLWAAGMRTLGTQAGEEGRRPESSKMGRRNGEPWGAVFGPAIYPEGTPPGTGGQRCSPPLLAMTTRLWAEVLGWGRSWMSHFPS